MLNRMIAGAREELQGFLADVYVKTDYRKGEAGGNSPGAVMENCGLCKTALCRLWHVLAR